MTRCLKFLPLTICLGAGLFGWRSQVLAQTNQAHRQQLLRSEAPNSDLARSSRAAQNGYVPANTLVFREWALGVMLTQANFLNQRWLLDLPKTITSDHVTRFSVLAKIDGPEGAIVINDRFAVEFYNGRWHSFRDIESCWENIEVDIPRLERLGKQTGSLTKARAGDLAREALHQVGLEARRLGISSPPDVTQREYESKQGKVFPLPLYEVGWRQAKEFVPIRIEISGLTAKPVFFVNYLAPAMTLPTNYFAMLGVSSRSSDWGAQFGYDSADTSEFQNAARQLAATQVNRLNEVWDLGSKRLSTNDLAVFLAKPRTNSFDIVMAQFGDRFYLQIAEGRIQLFKDQAHNVEALIKDDQTLRASLAATNSLSLTSAVQLARQALHQMGLNEQQLQLREPPTVTQVELPSDGGRPQKLPLYDVLWHFPPAEASKYGDNAAAIAFQISGLTRKVVMHANQLRLTPQLILPTNAAAPNALPQRRR